MTVQMMKTFNKILTALLFVTAIIGFAWKQQDDSLWCRKVVGAISQIVKPFQSECGRCGRTWAFADEHMTWYEPRDCTVKRPERGSGCFPLCETCWSELTIEERLPYYQELFLYWKSIGSAKTQEDWENMRIAVEMGK